MEVAVTVKTVRGKLYGLSSFTIGRILALDRRPPSPPLDSTHECKQGETAQWVLMLAPDSRIRPDAFVARLEIQPDNGPPRCILHHLCKK